MSSGSKGYFTLEHVGDWSYTETWINNSNTLDFITATNFFTVHNVNTQSVPEPATMLLLGSSLLGMGTLGRKKLVK